MHAGEGFAAEVEIPDRRPQGVHAAWPRDVSNITTHKFRAKMIVLSLYNSEYKQP